MTGAFSLGAQVVPTYRATDMNTYAVPVTIQTNFQATYPTATQVTWQPMNDWWYATYTTDHRRISRVYYNTQPYYLYHNENYQIALPITNNYVPSEVIDQAVGQYGTDLYSITAVKIDTTENMAYQVTLIKGGLSERVVMNGSGLAMNNHNSSANQY